MIEWHSRALHFLPHSDAWDFDRLGDLFSPICLSWMPVGAAMTLAHELGIFIIDNDHLGIGSSKVQRMRVRILLYVYVNQWASRIGCTSLLPENVSRSVRDRPTVPEMTKPERNWHGFMICWIGMT